MSSSSNTEGLSLAKKGLNISKNFIVNKDGELFGSYKINDTEVFLSDLLNPLSAEELLALVNTIFVFYMSEGRIKE
jgi:hypothetical protein